MQLIVSKETLLLALGRCQGIVGKKSTMPVLSNIYLETISNDRFTVTATDLDIFAKGEYEGVVEKAGKICVSAKDLHEIAKNLPAGNVQLETDDGSMVRIRTEKVNYSIRATNVSDYPSMPDFGEVSYAVIPSATLQDLIEHTLFSVANDDPRIFLNGVNLEKLEDTQVRLVSTDGHRLSLVERDIEAELALEHPVIISRKGLLEVKKMIEEGGEGLEVAFSGSNGFFRREDLLVVMRLIEGEFPDYNMVIPKGSDRIVKVDRALFQEALKRISILSVERSYGIRFHFAANELTIEASDPEKGEGRQSMEVEYDGPDFHVGFNARYFMDALNVMHGEQVLLELSDELSPCVLKDADDEGFFSVVMPMRIT